MKTTAKSGKDVVNADRHDAWELLRTVRDLRLSVAAGRPMTLPNCLRLCRRRLAAMGGMEAAVMIEHLEIMYRQHQPFQAGPQVIRSRSK